MGRMLGWLRGKGAADRDVAAPPTAMPAASGKSIDFPARAKPGASPKDREFLPAALEIQEVPRSPTRLWVTVAILALFAAAGLWSWFGRIEEFAELPGKVQAVGRTKVIQPIDAGAVTAIRVVDGDHVKEGDPLVELDPTDALADQAVAVDDLGSTRGQIQALRVVVAAASAAQIDVQAPVPWTADITQAVRAREENNLHAELSSLAATLANLAAQRKAKESDKDKYSAGVDAQQALVKVITERVGMSETLWKEGFNSRSTLLKLSQDLQENNLTLAKLQGSLAQAVAEIPVIDNQIAQARYTFVKTKMQELVTAERQEEDLTQQVAKANADVEHMTLRAPISGSVQASAVTTVGQVVTTGQQLMQVVPVGTPLEIEAYALNTDVGFLSVSQKANIKVSTFPYTRYGTIPGVVTRVARDALPNQSTGQQTQQASTTTSPFDGTLAPTTTAEMTQSLVYPVTVVPSQATMRVGGKDLPLTAGMLVTVELKTESRRAIDFILSPIMNVLATSAQER